MSQPCCLNKLSLPVRVLLGACIGLSLGLAMKFSDIESDVPGRVAGLPGKLWLNGLKLVVLPLIFSNMLTTSNSMKSLDGAGSIGKTAFYYYAATTVFATVLGLIVVVLIVVPTVGDLGGGSYDGSKTPEENLTTMDQVEGIFTGIVPSNIFAAASSGNLVGVIAFGIAMGMVLESGSPIVLLCEDLNRAMFSLIEILIFLTPLGVCSLIAPSIADMDFSKTGTSLGLLAAAILVGLLVQALIVYPMIFFLTTRKNPFHYYSKILPALSIAFGTSSSAATLPVTIECVQNANVHPTISKFVLSLGATCNMDGTAIYFPIAVVWLACTAGVQLQMAQLVMVCIISTLSSMGAAPIPSASLVLLVVILGSVTSVPTPESYAVIVAFDWLFDRCRTCVNVMSDAIAAGIVQHYAPPELLRDAEKTDEVLGAIAQKLSSSFCSHPSVQMTNVRSKTIGSLDEKAVPLC